MRYPRKIMLKLTTSNKAKELMQSEKRKKLAKDSKIYLNEDMTKEKNDIMYELRQMRRAEKIKAVWVYRGQIHAKQDENDRNTKVIENKADLEWFKKWVTRTDREDEENTASSSNDNRENENEEQ